LTGILEIEIKTLSLLLPLKQRDKPRDIPPIKIIAMIYAIKE